MNLIKENRKTGAYMPKRKDLPPRRISSNFLFQGGRRVIIEHDQCSYRLILTRNGKLILTK